ncbi:MAG: hypothetical protein IPH62_10480 [Ignavibacteriae bacterium]|nr:hypothetical protein [Ignavibacteriota bacterium]
MKLMKIFYLLILLTIIISCEENIVTECEDENQTSVTLTKFSDIQKNVFDASCAFSGCHAGASSQAGLQLTSGDSYSNLINKTSVLNPNFKLVEPGNSENSFLIKMLKHTGEGTSQMPPSGKLSNSVIDSIAAWIDRGALNN